MLELSKMNVDELEALRSDVDDAIHAASAEQKAAARKACEDLAHEYGYSLLELWESGQQKKSGNGQKKPRQPGVPKYRNPHNPAQTWTGKGKRPDWFVAALGFGSMTPESMLIERTTPP